jgi:hypothetical protein
MSRREKEERDRPRWIPDIEKAGCLFTPAKLGLMQEAAEIYFKDQGLIIEVVDPQKGDPSGKIRVKVFAGPNMDGLSDFWQRVNSVKLRRALGLAKSSHDVAKV